MISDKVEVISLSGGRTSAFLAHLKPNVKYVFMDTGAEHPATYDFIRSIVQYWKINLTCIRVVYNENLGTGCSYKVIALDELRQDLEPWRGMLKKYGSPSVYRPYCTARMKTEPHEKYCNEVFGRGNYTTWIGMRADEPARLIGKNPYLALKKTGIADFEITQMFRVIANAIDSKYPMPVEQVAKQYSIRPEVANAICKNVHASRKANIRYLAEISDFTKDDVLDWWCDQPFDLKIPEHLGNCVFCIKKGVNKVALAAKDEPEQAIKFIELSEGDEVRTTGRKYNGKEMYRGVLHLSDVLEAYKDTSRDELFNALRSSKRFDAGSCSESCEAFQLEMFGGVA